MAKAGRPCELMEAVEADRKDRRADMMGFTQCVKIHPDFAERYTNGYQAGQCR